MLRRTFLQAAGIAAAAGACTGEPDPSDEPRVTESSAAALTTSVDLGAVDDLLVQAAEGPVEVPHLRGYLVAVPDEHRDALADAYGAPVADGIRDGWLLLMKKCPHRGCRVPWCASSGRFECPCHGTAFSAFGEHVDGPADSGMLPTAIEVRDGHVHAAGVRLDGVQEPGTPLALGQSVTDHAPTGPGCLG